MKSMTIHVDNVVCDSCAKAISNEIKRIQPSAKTTVNVAKGEVAIVSSKEIVGSEIILALENIGYPRIDKKKKTISVIFYILAGVILLYFFKTKQNIVEIIDLSISQSYMMLFVVGVLTSFHCIFMCGGIAMSQSFGKEKQSENLKGSLTYNIGRVISYTIIGAVVGGIGSLVMVTDDFKGIVTILAGLFMIAFGMKFLGVIRFPKLIKINKLVQIDEENKYHSNFVVGLLNGFMPCGPLQTMQLYALSTGSVIVGGLSMLAFSLGTIPLMVGVGFFVAKVNRSHSARLLRMSAVAVIVLGLVMFNRGLLLYGTSLPGTSFMNGLLASSSTEESAITADGFQEITLVATGSDYQFSASEIKVDIPVRLYLDVQGISRCSNPLLIPKYDIMNDMLSDEAVIEFTPNEIGDLRVTCWMGMITTSIKVVE